MVRRRWPALTTQSLSIAQARRVTLAAQGFTAARPAGRVDRRHFRRVIDTLGVVQIDSVNVLTRAHEIAFFARLGPYDRAALAQWLHTSGEVFEYWGHEASFIDVADHPNLRWKMATSAWKHYMAEHQSYLDEVRRTIGDSGPLVPADLQTEPRKKSDGWWDWTPGKIALESLFVAGEITAIRGAQFQRLYDIPERVLPAATLALPTPPEDDARAALVLRAARALGVATANDLADYHRQKKTPVARVVKGLAAEGRLAEVQVEGWKDKAYLHPEARVPRAVNARAMLSPFDSVVWERARVERLFDFHYRIEIYTPAPKRVYGYYVLPFLLGDRLVGRVDLKADRQAGVLRVRAAHAEPEVDHAEAAAALSAELELMAGWLGLGSVDAAPVGNLAPALRATMS
jgi:uncharacterized protein YcaQ